MTIVMNHDNMTKEELSAAEPSLRRQWFYITFEIIKTNSDPMYWRPLLALLCSRAYEYDINECRMLHYSMKLFNYINKLSPEFYLAKDELSQARNIFYQRLSYGSDAQVKKRTGIDLTRYTNRQLETVNRRIKREDDFLKRLVALKRYVKKNYAVEKMLEALAKSDLEISRTKLYEDIYYWAILQGGKIRKGMIIGIDKAIVQERIDSKKGKISYAYLLGNVEYSMATVE
ncbi:hypothetical protein Geob_0591 [Geotalea daltonii FRC-32]|uniref:Uncharacterized protein n=1 Tax=Geotalea daltonii (strain DSM 22248 / JCM 15807 / FRC-32) TaxID=316067 RepID=B9M0C0_GEODF|nr:hypothetical protein [Geotalea daltonii]ACM18957.1 hypothetical protein Geob_0591 [Geotalea daltonii FRC-32]